jgi:chorismate-pyruvate lyase
MGSHSRRVRASIIAFALLAACLSGARARADAGPPGNETLALLQSLNAELLGHDSATATLQHWCAEHRLAVTPHITATLLPTAPMPVTPQQRALLQVGAGEPIRFRHVQLRCGDVVLADALNWYVPARLTAPMNRELGTTDTPFGVVVRALDFHRRRLEARVLWSPPQPLPEAVLEHRALLVLPDGTPISLVDETYLRSVLAPAPAP